MITDKQGREWLLEIFYNNGWRYCVRDNFGGLHLTNEKPVMYDDVDEINISSCNNRINIAAISDIFCELKRNECISIAEELGIVDWSKIEVDTPVFVRNIIAEVWKCRYFAEYKDGKVYTWRDGKTSWSNVVSDRPVAWGYAELAFKE